MAHVAQPAILVPAHLPAAPLSPDVQRSLSSHMPPSGAATAPHLSFASSQPATWHAVVTEPLQSRGWPVHVPAAQASFTVQNLPSEHCAPSSSVTWVHPV